VFVPGVGTAIAGAAFSASAAAGATLSAATLAAIQAGAATLIVATGLTIAANGLQMAKAANAISQAQLTRLNVSLDPSAPRKIAFGGSTALATDLRASIPTGTDQEYHEYVICVASHTVESITEIWFEDRQAWTVGGGIAAYYSGYLTTVTVRNPGTSANGIAINAQWPATSTLTGCAYVYLKVKRTGNSKKAESVLPQGIPSRVTIIGKGMKVYDPRLDSTVTGGSGSHRADDQTTWEYSHSGTDIGNNPALQILAYRLGWKINGKLAVGKGMLPERLDMPSFITAANICDEPVTLAIGGTQRRYETHGLFSEADATSSVENALLFACAGRMTDHNGKLGIALAYNDLTGTLYEFDDDDVLGAFDWNPSPSIHETHNIIRGRWTDPSSNSLYQMVDYPAIRITSPDGIDRTLTIDLPVVQDGKRAQRIAKQILQREQYQGTFAAIFGIRAWGVKVGDPVKLTFDTLGFVEKLFRVVQQGIRSDGTVQLILREEATALYAWAAEESALVTVAAPTVYDQLNNPLAVTSGVDIGVEDGATKNTTTYAASAPASPTDGDIWVDTSVTPNIAKLRDGGAWVSASNLVTTGSQIGVYDGTTNVPTPTTVQADYTGAVISGQLPRDIACTRKAGNTDVTTSATWSISATGCTATIGAATGIVNITAVASSGYIDVTSVYASITLVNRIVVTKVNASPPASGGSGSSSAYDSTVTGTGSTSYGSANAGTLTVTAGAAGQVDLSAPLETFVPSGTVGCKGKWQWRVVAGSWADVASEISSLASATASDPGYIEVNMSKTGLTNGVDYEFQLLMRLASAGSMTFSGTASAVAA